MLLENKQTTKNPKPQTEEKEHLLLRRETTAECVTALLAEVIRNSKASALLRQQW